MRRLILILLILPGVAACASLHDTAAKRSVDAVAQDEGQRQKVLSAINAGETPTQAMAKVADGPKNTQATPAQSAPK
jgi:ABC-type Fe3+ transport system substrate-binding protein